MRRLLLFSAICLAALPAIAQTIPGGNCSASNLNGIYAVNSEERTIGGNGSFTAFLVANGTATFDGIGAVKFAGTYDYSNQASAQQVSYSGSYTLPSNCYGTVTLTQGSSAVFALTVYSGGRQFDLTGVDSRFIYYGSGSNYTPVTCAAATLSGSYSYEVAGGMTGAGALPTSTELGVFQFDGQGNVKGVYFYNHVETSGSFSGTYTVAANCEAAITVQDATTSQTSTFNAVLEGPYGQAGTLIEGGAGNIRSGQLRSTFTNPGQSITNAASFTANATPAGSVFALFGNNLATGAGSAGSLPLSPTLENATVTVNGEPAPLFYAAPGQINAQMPWDIPGNTLATVIVKNTGPGGTTSNAAAVYVSKGATPGVSFFSSNRAVVINQDNSVNDSSHPAAVGDEVVLYFTGGGPVNPAGQLVSGAGAPSGLSPVTDPNASVTVGGVQAPVVYIGLTPTAVGLYQANFKVPQIAAGNWPVVITISGQASNTLGGPVPNPVMTVSN